MCHAFVVAPTSSSSRSIVECMLSIFLRLDRPSDKQRWPPAGLRASR